MELGWIDRGVKTFIPKGHFFSFLNYLALSYPVATTFTITFSNSSHSYDFRSEGSKHYLDNGDIGLAKVDILIAVIDYSV